MIQFRVCSETYCSHPHCSHKEVLFTSITFKHGVWALPEAVQALLCPSAEVGALWCLGEQDSTHPLPPLPAPQRKGPSPVATPLQCPRYCFQIGRLYPQEERCTGVTVESMGVELQVRQHQVIEGSEKLRARRPSHGPSLPSKDFPRHFPPSFSWRIP